MRLSRGADRLLDLLRWYGARFRRIFPKQAKLAAHLKVCVQQIRRYLLELKRAGFVQVLSGGRSSAEYVLLQAAQDHQHASENARLTRAQCATNARFEAGPTLYLSANVPVSRVARKPARKETALERAGRLFVAEG